MSEEVAVRDRGLALLADLEAAGAITETGLYLTRMIPLDQCEALAAMLGSVHRRSAWALADLLLATEKMYGESYTQIADATGLSNSYLMNLCWIAHKVPRPRRIPGLSLSHHEAVAKLEPEDQIRLLQAARDEGWTREKLRAEAGGRSLPPAGTKCECCGQLV